MFSREIADKILARLSAGESLRAICRDEGMPAESTVRLWAVDDVEGFAAQYARARDIGLDSIADEIVEIANTPEVGTVETDKIDKEGAPYTEVKRGDMIEHRRLKVDARKWYLSKLAPKRYGERLALEHSGEVGIAAQLRAARERRKREG